MCISRSFLCFAWKKKMKLIISLYFFKPLNSLAWALLASPPGLLVLHCRLYAWWFGAAPGGALLFLCPLIGIPLARTPATPQGVKDSTSTGLWGFSLLNLGLTEHLGVQLCHFPGNDILFLHGAHRERGLPSVHWPEGKGRGALWMMSLVLGTSPRDACCQAAGAESCPSLPYIPVVVLCAGWAPVPRHWGWFICPCVQDIYITGTWFLNQWVIAWVDAWMDE